jgi:hypothetical protein
LNAQKENRMDQEEQWIEDGNETAQVDDEDELAGSDLFADPRGEFQLTFENGICVSVTGIKAKYPMFLQSTGLTLWKSSKTLCSHLCSNSNIVRDKSVIELGAGLGLAGIVAQKLGAQKVVLTDGDTDTLDNMRENVSTNIETHDGEENDSIICKQLLWGRNVEDFREKWAPPEGFDVVMVCFLYIFSVQPHPPYVNLNTHYLYIE